MIGLTNQDKHINTYLFNIGPDSPGNKTSIGGATLLKSKCTTTEDGKDSIPSCDAKQLVWTPIINGTFVCFGKQREKKREKKYMKFISYM